MFTSASPKESRDDHSHDGMTWSPGGDLLTPLVELRRTVHQDARSRRQGRGLVGETWGKHHWEMIQGQMRGVNKEKKIRDDG